jgi:hypothetical protein
LCFHSMSAAEKMQWSRCDYFAEMASGSPSSMILSYHARTPV